MCMSGIIINRSGLFLKGQESPLEAKGPKVVNENKKTGSDNQTVVQREGLEIPTAEVKMKLFTGKYAAGLRIRSKPSFMVNSNNTICKLLKLMET